LLYRYYFNNALIDPDTTIKIFLKKSFGLGNFLNKLIEQRIENNLIPLIKDLNKNEADFFLKLIYISVPYNSSIIKRLKLNICLLDISTTYRG